MKKSGIRIAALAATAMILVAAQAGAVSVTMVGPDGEVTAGEDGTISATLQTMGEEVAGTQNDIIYPTGENVSIGVIANAQGRPTCAVNQDIGKEGTAFSFQPPNCNAAGTCTGVRALVLSLSNVDPIADGATLYTCEINVSAGTPGGAYELTTTGVGASDPDGNALAATGVAGEIEVSTGPAPVVIEVGDATGPADGNASLTVSLSADAGVEVAGTQNDIGFDPNAAVRAGSNGRPLCSANVAINKEGSAFSFQPPQCTVGTSCTAIRALVLSLSNVDPIPSGSALYTCDLATGAEGTYALTCTGPGSSDPDGNALDTDCTDGEAVVGGVIVDTPTPTEPVGVATNTPTPTTSGGATATVTRTRTGGVPINDCDDGCAVTAPAQTDNGFLVWLLPAAALLWLRRRAR
jgi:hypothetical protein